MTDSSTDQVKKPQVYIFAGPNGAGKSTYSAHFVPEHLKHSVFDPDRVMAQIDVQFASIGGLSLTVLNERITEAFHQSRIEAVRTKSDFAYETNFRTSEEIRIPEYFKANGYEVNMFFFALPSIESSSFRVKMRVIKDKGHYVDSDSVRFNFENSLLNIKKHFSFFDRMILLDNSGLQPKQLLKAELGSVQQIAKKIPKWAKEFFGDFINQNPQLKITPQIKKGRGL